MPFQRRLEWGGESALCSEEARSIGEVYQTGYVLLIWCFASEGLPPAEYK